MKTKKGENRNKDQLPGNEAGSPEGQVGVGYSPIPGTLLFPDFSFPAKNNLGVFLSLKRP